MRAIAVVLIFAGYLTIGLAQNATDQKVCLRLFGEWIEANKRSLPSFKLPASTPTARLKQRAMACRPIHPTPYVLDLAATVSDPHHLSLFAQMSRLVILELRPERDLYYTVEMFPWLSSYMF